MIYLYDLSIWDPWGTWSGLQSPGPQAPGFLDWTPDFWAPGLLGLLNQQELELERAGKAGIGTG